VGREADRALDDRRCSETNAWAYALALWAADQLRYPLDPSEMELKEIAKRTCVERVESTAVRFCPVTVNEAFPRPRREGAVIHPSRLKSRLKLDHDHDPPPAA
jgi:hypothetical protein